MRNSIHFETWKHKRVITIRNESGKIISRTYQKGSGIKSRRQAYIKFKRDNSLAKNTTKVSRKNNIVKDKSNIQKVVLKGTTKSKTVSVKRAKFINAVQIGANTTALMTENKMYNNDHYQMVATVFWGDKEEKTTGFSDLKGTKQQAFQKAINQAKIKNIFNYELKHIKWESESTGTISNDDGTKTVSFKVQFSYRTYINSTMKQFTTQRSLNEGLI